MRDESKESGAFKGFHGPLSRHRFWLTTPSSAAIEGTHAPVSWQPVDNAYDYCSFVGGIEEYLSMKEALGIGADDGLHHLSLLRLAQAIGLPSINGSDLVN